MSDAPGAPWFLRAISAGLAGGVAWMVGIAVFFGAGQAVLANPAYQSEKFVFVMTQLEPLPRTVEAWWILPLGLLAIGALYGVVYHFVRRAFPAGPWWRKGLGFGIAAWTLMVPWFEFYLPWNVMHEPFLLVMLEMVLWLTVLLLVGLVVARVYEIRRREPAATVDSSVSLEQPGGRHG